MSMKNKFKYSNSNKRYHTLDYFYKQKFGKKVCKISLNGGFTCPNKDGTKGFGGCIYCSKLGSGDYAGQKEKDIITQFNDIKSIMEKKWNDALYIGYFQANTNTYAKVDVLKEKYEPILKQKNVIGINIATRPDAISKECLDYLEELSKRTFLNIELGLQTIHETTTTLINRGHDLECFNQMVTELRKRNINVVVHLINGLPYETKEMMIDTIKHINTLDIQGIKIHMLHVIKDTKLEQIYQKEQFHILTKEEYIDIVIDQLELLRPEIVIHRITGDPVKEELIEPTWLTKKFCVLNDIDKEMVKRDSYQGKKLQQNKKES
ncbi:MAG: TIGR01212 family radical SAM protein [Bacilli bacterium]|nr:TIGR01212 family radical SAM protein [Bacilli bacterium]